MFSSTGSIAVIEASDRDIGQFVILNLLAGFNWNYL